MMTDDLLLAPPQSENTIIADIMELGAYHDGWDGGIALAPKAESIRDAMLFSQMVSAPAVRFEPTLHSDGSVLLEISGDAQGSLKFRGDGAVIYAISGFPPGEDLLSNVGASFLTYAKHAA